MFFFRQLIRKFATKSSCKKPTKKQECKQKASKKGRRSPDYIVGPSGVYPAHEGGFKIWRNVALFFCLPTIAVCAYNTFADRHEPERPEFVKLEYMYMRTKKFPWCGGTDRSLFHNPHLNALPDGYHDD